MIVTILRWIFRFRIKNSRSKREKAKCRVVVRLVAHICIEGRGVPHALRRQLAVWSDDEIKSCSGQQAGKIFLSYALVEKRSRGKDAKKTLSSPLRNSVFPSTKLTAIHFGIRQHEK